MTTTTDADDTGDIDSTTEDDSATNDDSTGDMQRCCCSLTDVLGVLGEKYAIELLCAAGAYGPVRFGELETALPDASTATLSKRLDELGEIGLVARTQYEEIPPRVEYELTTDGRECRARLEPLLDWTESESQSG